MCEPTGASNHAYGRREMGAKVERTGKKGEPLSNEKKTEGKNHQSLRIQYTLTRYGGGGTIWG